MPATDYQRSAYRERTAEAYIYLIVLEHDQLDTPIRLTNGIGDWSDAKQCYVRTIGGDEYFALVPFEIQPPGQSDEEQNGKLRIPNIDQRIGKAIEDIDGPPTATITCVLESDPTIVMGGPYEMLDVQNVNGDALVIEADLTWPSLTEELWPKGWIRPGKYRAAFRATA